jgi:hypothetical protein
MGPTYQGRLPPNSPRPRARWYCHRNSRRYAVHPSPPLRHEDAHVCACHLEPSRRLRCTMASHHSCPPMSALVGAASVGFRSRSLSDKALEQAAPLGKLPLPNACRGGHHLALPPRAGTLALPIVSRGSPLLLPLFPRPTHRHQT